MLEAPLLFTCQKVNAYLHSHLSVDSDIVVLGPPVDIDGKPVAEVKNRASLFLSNIVEDTVPRDGQSRLHRQGQQPTPLYFNLHFVVAAIFDPGLYREGLGVLGLVATFFQSNPIFTADREPDMPAGLNHLSYDALSLSGQDMSHVWGSMGGRYFPSIVYRLRSVIADGRAVRELAQQVSSYDPDVTRRAP